MHFREKKIQMYAFSNIYIYFEKTGDTMPVAPAALALLALANPTAPWRVAPRNVSPPAWSAWDLDTFRRLEALRHSRRQQALSDEVPSRPLPRRAHDP